MPKTPDNRTTIRFKPDEYAMLKAMAGRQPLSAFLRELALEKAVKRRQPSQPAPIKDHRTLAQILALLGPHDLTQAFRNSEQQIENGVVSADDETKLLILECHKFLSSIHTSLMHALGVAKQ